MREWLRDLRMERRLSQADIAQKAGISQQMYSFVETGNRGAKLSVCTAKAIAKALGFDWTRFYDDEAEVTKGE